MNLLQDGENRRTSRVIEERLKPYKIHLGIPRRFPHMRYLDAKNEPHVFYCGEVWFFRKGERERKESGVMVMSGHGYGFSDWRFVGTGISVFETAQAYDALAQEFNFPKLDALIVCNYHNQLSFTGGSNSGLSLSFANSPITLRREYDPSRDRWSDIFRQGEGVGFIAPDAQSWTYKPSGKFLTLRPIPQWALNAVK